MHDEGSRDQTVTPTSRNSKQSRVCEAGARDAKESQDRSIIEGVLREWI